MRTKLNRSSPYSPLGISKKLVYLDQSFLSELCSQEKYITPILKRLLLKLQNLKTMNKIGLVVSDIHCRETSAFPGKYSASMEKLWQFQNNLADGRIAASWEDVFVAQHRRMLSDENCESYSVADIRFRNPPQAHRGIRVVMTNSWLLRIHRDNVATYNEIDDRYRKVLDRQAQDIPRCEGVADCQNYIHGLWRNDIRSGMAAWRQRRDFLLSFEQLGKCPDAAQLTSLKILESRDEPLLRVIDNVTRGLDGAAVLGKWSDLLENDPIGPCPSMRIRTALEAELLWTWYEGDRHNPKKFRECFGWSRQNDIDHVSAFVPYVDALTTDKDMHNLCKREIVDAEIKRFPCRIFSGKNYDEFEEWLDELLAEAKALK